MERLKKLGLTIFSLVMVGAGIANLFHAATTGQIRARRGWISYNDHPAWFFFYVAASVAASLLFAAGIYLVWRDVRSIKKIKPKPDGPARGA